MVIQDMAMVVTMASVVILDTASITMVSAAIPDTASITMVSADILDMASITMGTGVTPATDLVIRDIDFGSKMTILTKATVLSRRFLHFKKVNAFKIVFIN